jgi:hypothetical protein
MRRKLLSGQSWRGIHGLGRESERVRFLDVIGRKQSTSPIASTFPPISVYLIEDFYDVSRGER